MGTLGLLAFSWMAPTVRLAILAAVVVAGLGAETGVFGSRLPTVRRQVNEEWMHAYRGWIYGFGYGVQLGAGVVTVVTTAAVYAVLAAELAGASPGAAALVGLVFGGGRGLSLLAGARLRTPAQLVALDGFLNRSDKASAIASRAGQAVVVLFCVVAAFR